MDIVKKSAGCVSHAGIGFIVGYIITAIFMGNPLWLFFGVEDLLDIIFLLVLVFSPILGGIAGGAVFKKWWGAIIGSGFVSVIVMIAALSITALFLD